MAARLLRFLIFLVSLFLVLMLSAIPALAQDDAANANIDVRVVRLSLAQGDVQIDRNVGVGWEQAINNMPIEGGTSVYAAEDSKAEVELEDGSSIRLVGPAQITLSQLSLAADGAPQNTVEVDSGLVYVNANLTAHADFRLEDADGESFVITQPSHLRFKVDEEVASLAVVDGAVQVLDAPGTPTIHGGESYNYVLGQPESAARLNKVLPESDDSWDRQRDQYEQQYAPSGAQYSGGENPDLYGAADLGYYGSYEDIPDYGESWQPSGVGADWDPFDYGAWSYYPDLGWTYVSGYPWGWCPFYFGDWFYVSGRGWWWHNGPHHLHHGPERPGGFHRMPRVTGGAGGHSFAALHPPSGANFRTVATAGSNLRVGPITATHATLANATLPGHNGISPSAIGHPVSNLARPAAGTSTGRAGAMASPRTSSPITITGRRGSYTVHGFAGGRSGGYEPRRVSVGDSRVPSVNMQRAPRSYRYVGGSHYGGSAYNGSAFTGGSAPRPMSVPSFSMQRAPMAPPASSFVPHTSGMGDGVSGFHGGGFSGGGVSGFHGGGLSVGGVAGGGFHGGGGRR